MAYPFIVEFTSRSRANSKAEIALQQLSFEQLFPLTIFLKLNFFRRARSLFSDRCGDVNAIVVDFYDGRVCLGLE
ncbi:MAG: hypothetical protein ACI9SC_002511 [Gammaproteobacteria bacterium]|jgi:hypothetical protein